MARLYELLPQNWKSQYPNNNKRTILYQGIMRVLSEEAYFLNSLNAKKPQQNKLLRLLKFGGDLLSHCYAVPSALTGLTSLFGMGRGGAPLL